jgi:hypothetical protein
LYDTSFLSLTCIRFGDVPVSPVSLDFPFLIAPSVFSGIYLFYYLHFSQSDIRYAILLYTIFSFAVIGFEEIFTVWASTDPVLGLYLVQWIHLFLSKCNGVLVCCIAQ